MRSSTTHDEVPANLVADVAREDDALVLARRGFQNLVILSTIALVTAVVVVPCVAAHLPALSLAAMATGALAAVVVPALEPEMGWRPLRLRRGVLEQPRLFRRDLLEPLSVRVRGEPGGPIHIDVSVGVSHVHLIGAKPLHDEVWTWDGLRWFAAAAAAQLAVPLVDELDHNGWARWLTEPLYRDEVLFLRSFQLNLKRNPRFHDVPPGDLKLSFGLHEVRAGSERMGMVHLDPTHLRFGEHAIPLLEILGIHSHFDRGAERGLVRVLTPYGTHDVVSWPARTDVESARIHALAALIEQHVADARPRGSTTDIPHAMRSILSARNVTL